MFTDGMHWAVRTGPFAGSFTILAGTFAVFITILAAIVAIGAWVWDGADLTE